MNNINYEIPKKLMEIKNIKKKILSILAYYYKVKVEEFGFTNVKIKVRIGRIFKIDLGSKEQCDLLLKNDKRIYNKNKEFLKNIYKGIINFGLIKLITDVNNENDFNIKKLKLEVECVK